MAWQFSSHAILKTSHGCAKYIQWLQYINLGQCNTILCIKNECRLHYFSKLLITQLLYYTNVSNFTFFCSSSYVQRSAVSMRAFRCHLKRHTTIKMYNRLFISTQYGYFIGFRSLIGNESYLLIIIIGLLEYNATTSL